MDQMVTHTNKDRGFTLIELMVVVVIVTILATIAYTSYARYVAEANLSSVRQFLLSVGNAEDQALLASSQYQCGTMSSSSSDSVLQMQQPGKVSSNYSITIYCPTNKSSYYQIKATPNSSTDVYSYGVQELDSDGTEKSNNVVANWGS